MALLPSSRMLSPVRDGSPWRTAEIALPYVANTLTRQGREAKERTLMRVGSKLRSTTCTTEVIVVRAPSVDGELRCCGGLLLEGADPGPEAAGRPDVLLGKRYTDQESGLELLCSKPGTGPVTLDGRPLAPKAAKTLPSSD
jgi:hypothetical protein